MKLLHTSALVLLLLENEIYESKAALDYLAKLDLSAGQDLLNKFYAHWPDYDQVVKNRKFAILHFIQQLSAQNACPEQIIIAGAGFDAMGTEIAARFVQTKIYELDEAFMDEKHELNPQERVHYLTGNLNDEKACLTTLKNAGWQEHQPSLMIYEGISYYIPTTTLQNLTAHINPTFAIIEYQRLLACLNERAIHIMESCFTAIVGEEAWPDLPRYEAEPLSALLNMDIMERLTLSHIEKHRLGENQFFPTEADSWIGITLFRKPT